MGLHETVSVPDFRALFESAPGLYLVLTPALTIVAVSDAYLDATMQRRESMMGRGLFDVFPDNPADPGATGTSNLRASLDRVLKNRVPDAMAVQKYDIRRPEAEGGGFEERFWSPINSPVFGPAGDVAWIIHKVTDVTDFVRLKQQGSEQVRQAELLKSRQAQMEAEIFQRAQEIQESNRKLRGANAELERLYAKTKDLEHLKTQELFRSFMDNSPVIAWMKDEAGRYVYVNRKARETFAGIREGITDAEIFPADIAARLRQHDLQIFQDQSARQERESFPQAGGVHDYLSFKFPFTDSANQRYTACVAVDVTDQKRLELQLLHAQKMEAVGLLAGGVAHDFNNLLTAILGYTELLMERYSETAPLMHDLAEIRKAGNRAAELVRQLLAFSRKQVLQPRVIDLNTLVADLERMLRRLIAENIHLRTHLAPGIGKIKADPGQVEQVIVNLAVNARDAMPDGGKLTIETLDVDLDEEYARGRPEVVPGPYVMIAVSDTGTGMDSATRARLFEPFFTTKERGKGTGMGLSTVYGIVKQSRGNIWVYSEPGKGTTFKVYFPRVADSAAAPVTPSARVTAPRGHETILVVEDEETLRDLVTRVLEHNGYRPLVAPDDEAALAISEKHPSEIHLMLTDVIMPGLGGRKLSERIVSRRPRTKIVYMSGYTDDAIVHHGVLESGTHFLQKPFTPDVLLKKLREVLGAPG